MDHQEAASTAIPPGDDRAGVHRRKTHDDDPRVCAFIDAAIAVLVPQVTGLESVGTYAGVGVIAVPAAHGACPEPVAVTVRHHPGGHACAAQAADVFTSS